MQNYSQMDDVRAVSLKFCVKFLIRRILEENERKESRTSEKCRLSPTSPFQFLLDESETEDAKTNVSDKDVCLFEDLIWRRLTRIDEKAVRSRVRNKLHFEVNLRLRRNINRLQCLVILRFFECSIHPAVCCLQMYIIFGGQDCPDLFHAPCQNLGGGSR